MRVLMNEIGNRKKIFLTEKNLEEKEVEYKRLRLYAGYVAEKCTRYSGESYSSS